MRRALIAVAVLVIALVAISRFRNAMGYDPTFGTPAPAIATQTETAPAPPAPVAPVAAKPIPTRQMSMLYALAHPEEVEARHEEERAAARAEASSAGVPEQVSNGDDIEFDPAEAMREKGASIARSSAWSCANDHATQLLYQGARSRAAILEAVAAACRPVTEAYLTGRLGYTGAEAYAIVMPELQSGIDSALMHEGATVR